MKVEQFQVRVRKGLTRPGYSTKEILKVVFNSAPMFRTAVLLLVLVVGARPGVCEEGELAAPAAAASQVAGVVVLEGDIPVPGVEVQLSGAGHVFRAVADETGYFRFDAIPRGRYQLTLTEAGYGVANQIVDVDGRPIEVTLRATGEVIVQHERYRTRADRLRESAESVQVIETTRLRRESADTGEVLARTGGVTVARAGALGSDARLSLAGLSGDQVRVFVDGVPLELAGFPFGVANVPLNLVERVEIYSGVVPIRFGADALGGAINLVTPDMPARARVAASYQLGSFGTHRVATDASTRSVEDGVYLRGYGFLDRAANDYPVDVEVPDASGRLHDERVSRFNDGYSAGGGGIEAGFVDRGGVERLAVRGFGGGQRKSIQHDPVMAVPYGDVRSSSYVAGGSVQLAAKLATNTRVDAVGGYTRGRVRFVDVGDCIYDWFGECIRERAEPGEIEGIARDRVMWSDGGYALATGEHRFAPEHALRVSIAPSWISRHGDERRQRDPAALDPLTTRRDLLTHVGGVEYEVDAWGDRLESITFIKNYLQRARANGTTAMLSRDTHHLGFGEGTRVRVLPWAWLKASYEYATRLPRPDEVFGDGVLVEENLDLAPEVSHNANLGVTVDSAESASGAWRASATAFVRDADQLVTLVGASLYYRYQNVLSARALGGEVTASWVSPNKLVAADVAGTFQDIRNTSTSGPFAGFEGDRVPNRPYLTASAGLRLSLHDVARNRDELTVGATSRYVHEFFRSWESLGGGGAKPQVPSQLVHGTVVTYAIVLDAHRTVAMTAELQNVTDERVYDLFGVQRPGRALFFKTLIEM